ncbi:Translocation protein sec72 [Golovinomyces cichoracearum]|uniref:Translocation protein sec72 n=1 Tax=Golovinomyces cichoracearum TaxID=62708 RepID=A0A420HVT5_9PEZI|nr:Translocation protein sec72 [Golovinomyces cichoracearum]
MDEETFTFLPIQIDTSGNKTCVTTSSESQSLQRELELLNQLNQSLINLKSPVPPPPVSVNPKHSASITKLRESGNTAFRQGKHAEAIRLYSLGLEMCSKRPLWEPCSLFRDEAANLYANRSQVNMSLQNWPEGAIDAEASVEAKKFGNTKAWWRRGRCLLEMGRINEATQWVETALAIEENDAELSSLLREIRRREKGMKKT